MLRNSQLLNSYVVPLESCYVLSPKSFIMVIGMNRRAEEQKSNAGDQDNQVPPLEEVSMGDQTLNVPPR